MTDRTPKDLAKKASRAAFAPLTQRLDFVRRDLEHVQERQDRLAAGLEQAQAAVARLEAFVDRVREELLAEIGHHDDTAVAAQAVAAELAPDDPARAGDHLRERFDHALHHAERVTEQFRRDVDQQLADLRGTTRLTQALVERVLDAPPAARQPAEEAEGGEDPGSTAPGAPADAPPAAAATHRAAYANPTPSFDLLYRSFEDRHRGTTEAITERQREDYLDLLVALPNPELPVADLGCGRGELVELLTGAGVQAVGVDANVGQVPADQEHRFVQDDLFRWLDGQPDGSHRAVISLHVVEHVPLDLQVRLVFEARRVLAPGGLLVLETPNTLSLSTAATNFWVDPTHQRPVHPLYLQFLASEAGFGSIELRPLHPIDLHFSGAEAAPELAADLQSLVLGHGDLALLAWR